MTGPIRLSHSAIIAVSLILHGCGGETATPSASESGGVNQQVVVSEATGSDSIVTPEVVAPDTDTTDNSSQENANDTNQTPEVTQPEVAVPESDTTDNSSHENANDTNQTPEVTQPEVAAPESDTTDNSSQENANETEQTPEVTEPEVAVPESDTTDNSSQESTNETDQTTEPEVATPETDTSDNTNQENTSETDQATETTEPSEPPESQVSIALLTGNALVVDNVNDLIAATIDQIDADRSRYNTDIQQLFLLQDDGAADANSLTSISWDPTHDASTLIPTFGVNASVLHTNDVTDDTRTVYQKSIAVIGKTPGRYMVIGSNPMRNSRRNPDSVGEQMHSFLNNSIDWLTSRDANNSASLNVVIAHMDDSYYFPDETATREWLDTRFDSAVTYNDEDSCDDNNLNSCLTTDTDLLIISQILNDNSSASAIAEIVRAAMSEGTPVLYMHHNGGITALAEACLLYTSPSPRDS